MKPNFNFLVRIFSVGITKETGVSYCDLTVISNQNRLGNDDHMPSLILTRLLK